MAFIFLPGQMLTYKIQLHLEESQATVFVQTPSKALESTSHSGRPPAQLTEFIGATGCLEVGLGGPTARSLDSQERRRLNSADAVLSAP